MKYITFKELEQLAIKEGIKANRVTVGRWAKNKGYLKKIIYINKTATVVYI